MEPGSMMDRISVLRLTIPESERGGYAYSELKKLSCDAELTNKQNIFSKIGVGARDVKFKIRHNGYLELDDRILWRDLHCFITSIIPIDRLYDEVDCAIVPISQCKLIEHGEPDGPTFPGILTEQYVRYQEPADPYSTQVVGYALITPKQIMIAAGSLVEICDTAYHVQTVHALDPHKNEYGIVKVSDL